MAAPWDSWPCGVTRSCAQCPSEPFRCNRQESIALACVRGKERRHQVRQTQGCSSRQYHVFSLSLHLWVLLLLILPDLRRVVFRGAGKVAIDSPDGTPSSISGAGDCLSPWFKKKKKKSQSRLLIGLA